MNDESQRASLPEARMILLSELNHIFDDVKEVSCTRLSLAIELLIDAKLREYSEKALEILSSHKTRERT